MLRIGEFGLCYTGRINRCVAYITQYEYSIFSNSIFGVVTSDVVVKAIHIHFLFTKTERVR